MVRSTRSTESTHLCNPAVFPDATLITDTSPSQYANNFLKCPFTCSASSRVGTKISARVADASYPSPPSSAPSPDHDPARRTYTFRVQVEDLLHEGDAVGSGLPAPRPCSSEYIAALQREGDCLRRMTKCGHVRAVSVFYLVSPVSAKTEWLHRFSVFHVSFTISTLRKTNGQGVQFASTL